MKILKQDVLAHPWDDTLKIKRPRTERKLPYILSREEVNRLIECTINPKHKAILAVLYSSGIRRDELLHIRLTDIDTSRKVIRISAGKGNVDRDVLLATKTLSLLRNYYRCVYPKPSTYLFESRTEGKPYSASSVRMIVRKAAIRAGITKQIHPHSLRHAFATHLMEQGQNLKIIQQLLGHRSLRSTLVYLHLAGIEATVTSPFDQE